MESNNKQVQNSENGSIRHFACLLADLLWNKVKALGDCLTAGPRCVVWSGQAALSDLLLRPEEVATVISSVSMDGTG